MGWLSRKCPYCQCGNLYLKRTSPTEMWGCRECESKAALMLKHGMSKKEIIKVLSKED